MIRSYIDTFNVWMVQWNFYTGLTAMPKQIVAPSAVPFRPHLACDIGPTIPFGDDWVAMPKIDGVRGLVRGGELVGRNLEQFASPLAQSDIFHPLLEGADGEITLGASPVAPGLVGSTTGALNRSRLGRAGEFHYWVFDFLSPAVIDLPYRDRLAVAQHVVSTLGANNVHIVPTYDIRAESSAWNLFSSFESVGYEGAILRHLGGLHKNGRATVKEGAFMRMKSFLDFEIIVHTVVQGTTNTNPPTTDRLGRIKRSSHQEALLPTDMAGALIGEVCEDVVWREHIVVRKGQIITAGMGAMSHKDRAEVFANRLAYVGKMATIKAMPYGAKGVPRFAGWRAWRHDL